MYVVLWLPLVAWLTSGQPFLTKSRNFGPVLAGKLPAKLVRKIGLAKSNTFATSSEVFAAIWKNACAHQTTYVNVIYYMYYVVCTYL